jgi:F420-dependent oxidoreductase-like protein
MKLGIEIDWQSRHLRVPLERIRLADTIGYDMVFTAEANGSDAITPLAYILGKTERIGVGTHIAQTIGRTPAALAMAFQSLRQLAGPERAVIAGLGSSSPEQAMGWHGIPWTPPHGRTRDFVAIMRQAFRGEALNHQGKVLQVPHVAEDGRGADLAIAPLLETDPSIPILFGGGTELMLTLAAEIADGWMPLSYAPSMTGVYRDIIAKGFAKRADPPPMDDFPIWTHVDVIVTDDIPDAMRQFRQYVARWVGGWVTSTGLAPFAQQVVWRGFGDIVPRVQELWAAGREQEAADTVPDELIEDGWLFGSLDRILEQWKARWVDQGVNLIVRTDNWPMAKPTGNLVYEPLLRAVRG